MSPTKDDPRRDPPVSDTPDTDASDTEAFLREIERTIGMWLVTQTVYPQLPEAIRAVYTGDWRKKTSLTGAPYSASTTPSATPKIIV